MPILISIKSINIQYILISRKAIYLAIDYLAIYIYEYCLYNKIEYFVLKYHKEINYHGDK